MAKKEIPQYEYDYYSYQNETIKIDPHFISKDYIREFNRTHDEQGNTVLSEKVEKEIDYGILSSLGAKQNTYPTEEMRDEIDAYSTFLIKKAVNHRLSNSYKMLALRDLLPIDIIAEGDLGAEVFNHSYMRPKTWHQVYNIKFRTNQSKMLFTNTGVKEILIYGFQNIDPEFHHTTGAISNISAYSPLLLVSSLASRRIEYLVENFEGDLMIGDPGKDKRMPEYEKERLKNLYQSKNANNSSMSAETFLENVNNFLTYMQRGVPYQLNFSLTKEVSHIDKKISENFEKMVDDKTTETNEETFIRVLGLVVEPMGYSVAGGS